MCPRRRASAACSPVCGDAALAMDFPVWPVDRLPIFLDEAASTAAPADWWHWPWGRGIRKWISGAVVGECGHSSFGQFVCGAVFNEERSVASVATAMSGFSKSEGDNADAINQADGEAQNPGDQGAVIQDLLARLILKPLDGLRGNGTAIHIPTRFSSQATKVESSFDARR